MNVKARRKNSISDRILVALEAVDGYVEDYLYYTHIYKKGYNPIRKSSYAQALNRLRKQGLIEDRKVDDRVLIKLTNIGKDFLDLEMNKEEAWDGKWRVVIFDIPEQKRIIRNLFRRNLKRWGFKQLQKSVWISKRGLYKKIIAYARDLAIDKWVIVMESTKVSDQAWEKIH